MKTIATTREIRRKEIDRRKGGKGRKNINATDKGDNESNRPQNKTKQTDKQTNKQTNKKARNKKKRKSKNHKGKSITE
jgi:hypothetical protein